jgi:hypothetical protein
LREEIEGLKNQFLGRYELYHFLTKEMRDAPLFNGRFTEEKLQTISEKIIDFDSVDEFFICGPTEMILQSHRRSPVGMLSGMLDGNPGLPRILLASINCGDAICYDSRILHRGRGYGNTSGDNQEFEHRPVLVIRWDANHSPAPGTGMIGTQLAKWAGTSLALVATLLDWLP